MNDMNKFQPTARMMAALSRQVKDRGLDASLTESLAPFASSTSRIDLVTEGLANFIEEKGKGVAKAGAEIGNLIQMAATEIEKAKTGKSVVKALRNALVDWKASSAEDGGDIFNTVHASAEGPMGDIHGDPKLGWMNPRVRAQVDGFLARVRPGHKPENHSRQFASMSLLDHAKYSLAQSGHHGPGLFGSSMRTVEMALHSTSDFPQFLEAAGNRMLLDGYEAAQSGLKQLSREMSAPDFRSMSGLQLGSAPDLEEVAEGGTFKHGTVSETGETIQLATYGKIFGMTRQAIVNDDLNAFDQVFPQMGEAAARLEGQKFAELLEANSGAGPTMSDGNALFHADHGNIGTPGVPSTATIALGRTLMRRQTGLAGERINVVPKYLVVPPELETTAEQLVSEVQAVEVAETNPFAGKLEVVVDAFLENSQHWYLAAQPGRPAGLTHAYLDGQSGAQLFTQEGFEIDGIMYKVRLDFAAAFMGWRSWYLNPYAG